MQAGWGFSRVVDIFEAGLWCAHALSSQAARLPSAPHSLRGFCSAATETANIPPLYTVRLRQASSNGALPLPKLSSKASGAGPRFSRFQWGQRLKIGLLKHPWLN